MGEDKTINIKIPFDVHKKLKILATIEGISLKEFTTKALEEYCQTHGGKEVKNLKVGAK